MLHLRSAETGAAIRWSSSRRKGEHGWWVECTATGSSAAPTIRSGRRPTCCVRCRTSTRTLPAAKQIYVIGFQQRDVAGGDSHGLVFERIAEVAEREKIPFTITATPKYTSTDADSIAVSRGGVATALVSVPNRYMHSPNEMVSLSDLDATAELIAAFCRDIENADDFVHR